jgi:ATP-dependent protease ClpP protease subunit
VRRLKALQRDKGIEPPTDWFRVGPVRNEVVGEQDGDAPSRSAADIYVYESIGGWFGMTADDFVRDVAGLDVDRLNVHLNSPGGDAWEGIAMANVLRQHRATVTVWVDGIAASAASVVAMAGDEIVMGVGSQLMIHDAWTVAVGNAGDLRKEAEVADSVSDAIAEAYAAKAGGTAAEWRAVMRAEAWYTGPEAVAAGLADRVATDEDKGRAGGEQIVPGSSSGGLWDWWDSAADPGRHAAALRTLYAHAGRADAPAPRMPGRSADKTPAATASGSTHKERSTPVAFTDEHLATMRTKLGLAADASEDKIVATVAEVMEEFIKDDSEPKASLPEGTVAVDKDIWEQTRADAQAGREARQQQQAERRERLVNQAIGDGKIAPARREHWLNALKADPEGAEAQLASLAAGLIPVNELGHDQAGAAETSGINQTEYEAMAAALGIPKGA